MKLCLNYIAKRLLLMVPTLWGIITMGLIVIQFLPGGPTATIAELTMPQISSTSRLKAREKSQHNQKRSQIGQGVSDETLARIQKMYGFDKPVPPLL